MGPEISSKKPVCQEHGDQETGDQKTGARNLGVGNEGAKKLGAKNLEARILRARNLIQGSWGPGSLSSITWKPGYRMSFNRECYKN